MRISEKLMADITEAVNDVLKKHKGVIDSYRFKVALVASTADVTLRIRDMTDSELQSKDGK